MSDPAAPSRRVLIVDDNRILADSLAAILRSAGYDPWPFYGAETALTALSWKPHLAILDVHLPGIHGLDFALHLQRVCPSCHILLLSGDTHTPELVQQFRRDGLPFDVLPKPLRPELLLRLIAERLRLPPAP